MRTVLSILVTLLLAAVTTAVTGVLLLHFVALKTQLPSIWSLDGEKMTGLLATSLPYWVSAAALSLVLTLLILLNRKRFRRFFVFCAAAAIVNLAVNFVLYFFSPYLIGYLPNPLPSMLEGYANTIADFLLLCSIPLIALAVLSFSIYASIRSLKGKGESHA